MRKPDFCLCENNGTDQLGSNWVAAQCLCFRYIDSSSSYIQNLKPLAIFCSCTALFVSDLVGNHEDMFSRDAAHI